MVAALVVLSTLAFAGAVAGTQTTPDAREATVQTDQQTINTTLTARAPVTGNTTLYERGETLSDMPVYLLAPTPNLTVVATTTVPASQPVNVTQQVVLELTAVRNGQVFWENRTTLATTATQVTDGQVRTTATLDVRRLARERIAEIEAETGNVGTVEARIAVDATYDTGVYTGRTNVSTPVTISDRAYEVDTPQLDQQSHATMASRTVNASGTAGAGTAGLSQQTLLWVSGGILSLVLSGLVWSTQRRIDDFEEFRDHYERVRYVEWISRGRIPETETYVRVPVETLLDLVDIAIDSEKRVIHDAEQEIYGVVDGNLMYEFRDDGNAPERMYEFGLAPIGDTDDSLEQELAAAQAAVGDETDEQPGW
jgi:hypothetical protein